MKAKGFVCGYKFYEILILLNVGGSICQEMVVFFHYRCHLILLLFSSWLLFVTNIEYLSFAKIVFGANGANNYNFSMISINDPVDMISINNPVELTYMIRYNMNNLSYFISIMNLS